MSPRDDEWDEQSGDPPGSEPVFEVIHARLEQFKQMLSEPVMVSLSELDIQLGILPDVLGLLAEGRWAAARKWCAEKLVAERPPGYQQDGIRLVAGESRLKPFEEFEEG